jgi:hypothetical protein
MEYEKMNLHPEMNAELRALIEDFESAANRLKAFLDPNDNLLKENSDPANYFALMIRMFYVEPDGSSKVRRMNHICSDDFTYTVRQDLKRLL